MSAKDNSGPAFCGAYDMVFVEDGKTQPLYKVEARSKGMSLRDYFAAHAPQAPKGWHGGEDGTNDLASWAWNYADAMLAERVK